MCMHVYLMSKRCGPWLAPPDGASDLGPTVCACQLCLAYFRPFICIRVKFISKRCRPWLGAARCGVRPGTALLMYYPIMSTLIYVHMCIHVYLMSKLCGPWLDAAWVGDGSETATLAYVPIISTLTHVFFYVSMLVLCARGADPDWAPQNAASDLELHRLRMLQYYDYAYLHPYMCIHVYLISKWCGHWLGTALCGSDLGLLCLRKSELWQRLPATI